MTTPEAQARLQIDAALAAAGWLVQDYAERDIAAGPGIAIREFPLKQGHGTADYLLYVDQQAVGVLEAKRAGETLSSVEVQTEKYATGLPDELPAPHRPLPFQYQSTGIETYFTNLLDPEPRARLLFAPHRPEVLGEWSGLRPGLGGAAPPPGLMAAGGVRGGYASTLRARLRNLPPLDTAGMWSAQVRAVTSLERSLAQDRPRALVQMATGTGKTFVAVTSIYRLIKFGGARRVLFLVDRANLGRQALAQFQSYTTPDDGRKFTEIYNVQRLTSNNIDRSARVVISTVQRLYSILQGEEIDEEADERSGFESGAPPGGHPVTVSYNPDVPVETFDVVFIDECHRSIYNLWRQVLDYFDAHLVGLTATPSRQTLGFFDQNLVMEYGHEQAVVDQINVGGQVYRIRTRITEDGETVDAGHYVDRRNRETRAVRQERLDEDLEYGPGQLDRDVVAVDQIRTVIQAFRDRLPGEIFPGRTEVPKTLIFAKDDSHAEDIVRIVREEFGKGNAFAQKITYRTNTARVVTAETGPDGQPVETVRYVSTGLKAEDLLSSFRNSYNPRIVVTVDMIATGTDIRPLEIVMFMRNVRSRLFFEQMKGRGVRTIDRNDLQRVTPDAAFKDHFVIVDCVGVCEGDLADTPPLERDPSISLERLLDFVASGSTDVEVVSTLASRLARLDMQLTDRQRTAIADLAGGTSVAALASGIVEALDPDRQVEEARTAEGLAPGEQPGDEAVAAAAQRLIAAALRPIARSGDLRTELASARRQLEQTIDSVSKDEVLVAGFTEDDRQRARTVVRSFEQFVAENRDEITALQVLYSRPYGHGLRFDDIRELAERVQAPPHSLRPEAVWAAYEALDRSGVRGGGYRTLTDLVSLVRHAMNPDGDLVPFREQVMERFGAWLVEQQAGGGTFTVDQLRWLEMIRDSIAGSIAIDVDAFDYAPFNALGGAGRAHDLFGDGLAGVLAELNEVLVR